MDYNDVLAHCLDKPGAWQDEPWEDHPVAKVGEKIFCFVGENSIGVKCGANRDEADEWLLRHPDDASVMPYIGRNGWNNLNTHGKIPQQELIEAIDDSYLMVVSKLPKKHRPAGWEDA